MYLLIFSSVVLWACSAGESDIRNLMGEPDYRQIRLIWETDSSEAPKSGYNVRYCELQTWGPQRCGTQDVKSPTDNQNNIDSNDNAKVFTANIKGLRMATKYLFEIREIKDDKERENRAEGDDKNQNVIIIPTKGFSAKATQCLPHASEIEVSTGPYFGGRIAVEATDGERCAINGEPDSPRDTYTLRINHTECGSQVNDTTVATFVLVQENLPILTHSTRRFLVLCSYQPETLTVRAGISLPTGQHRGQIQMQPSEEEADGNALGRRSRNLRTGRLMHKPEALVKEETITQSTPKSYKNNVVPIFVITMLTIAGVIGIVAIALKFTSKKLLQDLDNVSIASEISTSSSCSAVSDIQENKTRSAGSSKV